MSLFVRFLGADLPHYAPDYSSVEDIVPALMASLSQGEGDSRFRDSKRDLLKGVVEKPKLVITNVPNTPPLPFVTHLLCYSSSPSASMSSKIMGLM
ncbi:hypothetical protein L6452_30507 [Arctium lappa]|uniref:Uncharacterized protein n=1 Tax=Arctium lappa TaxID=4217 RepID=A0ACB8ZHM4_ARCLA|nr:hypothetical protein L6452_30507 [Arctium lappa]